MNCLNLRACIHVSYKLVSVYVHSPFNWSISFVGLRIRREPSSNLTTKLLLIVVRCPHPTIPYPQTLTYVNMNNPSSIVVSLNHIPVHYDVNEIDISGCDLFSLKSRLLSFRNKKNILHSYKSENCFPIFFTNP